MKAQSSMEFLFTFGMGVLLTLILAGIFYNYFFEAGDELNRAEIEEFGTEIISTTEQVYFLGRGSTVTVDLDLGSNVENVSIHTDTNDLGEEFDYLNVTYYYGGSTVSDIFTTKELYTRFNCTICYTQGNVSWFDESFLSSGPKKLRLSSEGDIVVLEFILDDTVTYVSDPGATGGGSGAVSLDSGNVSTGSNTTGSNATSNITTVEVTNQYAYSEHFGYISLSGPGYNVTYDNSTGNFSGYAYSEHLGFISFRGPLYGVSLINDTLTGYAYSEHFGYISMSGPGYAVTVNSSNHMTGYAYGAHLGFIAFGIDNVSSSTMIEVDSGILGNYAYSEHFGYISLSGTGYNVTYNNVTDEFDGYAYGEHTGFVSFRGPLYGVDLVNDTLTGFAYSENFGYISLSGTGYGVTVDSSGNFSGYAYGEHLGYIDFGSAYIQ